MQTGDVGKIKGTGHIGEIKKPIEHVHKVIKEEENVSPFGTTGSTISKEALQKTVAEKKETTSAKGTKLPQSREQVPTFITGMDFVTGAFSTVSGKADVNFIKTSALTDLESAKETLEKSYTSATNLP